MRILFIIAISFLIVFACNKQQTRKPLDAGIFTVDKPPDTWYYLKDYLKQNNVKLTFYIESYQTISDSTKRIMKEMEADGHEIAHHTSTHPPSCR
ncbi:MAG: polysaccharide deacetylase family protein [Bacteroidia bacterium]